MPHSAISRVIIIYLMCEKNKISADCITHAVVFAQAVLVAMKAHTATTRGRHWCRPAASTVVISETYGMR